MRTRFMFAASAIVLACGVVACGNSGDAITANRSSSNCVLASGTAGGKRCFDSYRAAIRYATRGLIADAPLSARQATRDRHFKAEVAALHEARAAVAARGLRIVNVAEVDQGNMVIGATLFTGPNFTGASLTVMIPKPCVKNGVYDYEVRLGPGYSRRIESVEPWAYCWIWLHEGDTADSAREGPYKTDTADLGDWKDRAVLVGLS
jgi:hypothetical protein